MNQLRAHLPVIALLAVVVIVVICATVLAATSHTVPDQLWLLGGLAVGGGAGATIPRWRAEPILDHGRVYGAEVDRVAQVAFVQVAQIRVIAIHTTLDPGAEHEHRAGSAVVRALTPILSDASTEL